MNFLALICAIVLRLKHPPAKPDRLAKKFLPYFALLERNLNDGKYLHGLIAYLLAAFLPAIIVGVVYYWLSSLHALLGVAFSIPLLYLCLRFTQFEPEAEKIALSLQYGNIDLARQQYSAWQHVDARRYTTSHIAKLSIEHTFINAHLYLFGPLFWLIVLGLAGLGPAPVVLYTLSHQVKALWSKHAEFGLPAEHIFQKLDWLPAHATASAFAMVGDFEDAIYCWRTQAETWADRNIGIILASGGGALGVKLGDNLLNQGIIQNRPELGLGDEADADYLKSAIGMIWRVLVLLVGFMLLLTLAYWMGN